MFNLINSNYSNCQFIFDNGNKCNCWTSTNQLNAFSPIKNHINELFNYAHPHQYGELTTETLKHNPYQPFNNKRRNNQDPDQNSSNLWNLLKDYEEILPKPKINLISERVRLSIDSLSDLKRVILANEYPVTFVPFIAHPEIEKDICEIIHLNLMSLFSPRSQDYCGIVISGGSDTGKTHIGFETENI
ncbi:14172_t:CDS:2, partial [Entrophospora sp. SA101]